MKSFTDWTTELNEDSRINSEKVNPDKHLAAGTKVQVNYRPSKHHGMTGTVTSHIGTRVTVQHEDGSETHHISTLHHASGGAKPVL